MCSALVFKFQMSGGPVCLVNCYGRKKNTLRCVLMHKKNKSNNKKRVIMWSGDDNAPTIFRYLHFGFALVYCIYYAVTFVIYYWWCITSICLYCGWCWMFFFVEGVKCLDPGLWVSEVSRKGLNVFNKNKQMEFAGWYSS